VRNILIAVPSKKEKLPLSVTHPELAKEADGWDPEEYRSGSHEKLQWKCHKGHIFKRRLSSHVQVKRCPVCRIGGVVDKETSLTNPKYAKVLLEVDGWNPEGLTAGSNHKKRWKCSQGHTWIATIKNRVLIGSGCPVCVGRKVKVGYNDLKTKNPSLASQAYGWDPSTVTAHSSREEEWICNNGHIWKAIISNRSSGTGCPYCSGKIPILGESDLATTNPELISEIDGWDPRVVRKGSNKSVPWKCKFGHKWTAVIYERATEGTGCPVCKNQRTDTGVNDLSTTHPIISREAVGWEPKQVNAGSHKRVKWKCALGHEWTAAIINRTRENQGCPTCANRIVLTGFNDLKTVYPEHSVLADGWDPAQILAGSHSRKKWKCQLGHTWSATIDSKVNNIFLCPFCSNRKLWPGFNDLNTLFPHLAKEANGFDPKEVHPGTSKKMSWLCSSGHKWMASVASRTGSSQAGCPSCATSGFDPNKDACIYFLLHSDWKMFQIGITNFPDDRIASHKKLRWEILEIRGPMDGLLAQQWERAILRMLKAKGADLSNSKIAGKFDGYSEAWSKTTFEVASIKELMRLTEEFEEPAN
jgi:hypothetical protein